MILPILWFTCALVTAARYPLLVPTPRLCQCEAADLAVWVLMAAMSLPLYLVFWPVMGPMVVAIRSRGLKRR